MKIRKLKSFYYSLNETPFSRNAFALVEDILSTKKMRAKRAAALGSMLAPLLNLKAPETTALYRSMSSGSFTGEAIGYRVFRSLTKALVDGGWITVKIGFKASSLPGAASAATEFQPTKALLEKAASLGITPDNWRCHFKPRPMPATVQEPIQLRTSSAKAFGTFGPKLPGKRVRFDRTSPLVRDKIVQMEEINASLAKHRIEIPDGIGFYGFRRVFSQGDVRGFAWNKGGRTYAIGGSYQQLDFKARSNILLDGKSVVEVDIKASHITIYHGLLNAIGFDTTTDPYTIAGINRPIVKRYVTQTMGANALPYRWVDENKAWYADIYGGDLQKDYPAKLVGEALCAKHPALAGWKDQPLRWGDLQFAESEVLTEVIHTLCVEHGIPALPVHDSVILPQQHESLACRLISSVFESKIGVRPQLVTKKS